MELLLALILSLAAAVSSNLLTILLGNEGTMSIHMSGLCECAYMQICIIQLFDMPSLNLFIIVNTLTKSSLCSMLQLCHSSTTQF